MPTTKGNPINPNHLSNIKYDETSPSCLRFKERTHFNQHPELVVGTHMDVERNRGWAFLISKAAYRCHRVVWFLCKGEDPYGFEIDHIDGNPWNNKIENLRKVTRETNVRNAKKRKDNDSGVTGIYMNNAGAGCTYWTCTWREIVNEKSVPKKKHFPINKLGNEQAFRMACEYRAQRMMELQKAGAGYTDRHGK